MPRQPEYGKELDYGDGTKLPNDDRPPKVEPDFELTDEDLMGLTGARPSTTTAA